MIISVPSSPPATAACRPADRPATQLQTSIFHIDISSRLVYILRVSLASQSACISTWLRRHSFHQLFTFNCHPYLFFQKVLWISLMDTTPTRGSFPCPPNSLLLSAPCPWLGMMPDTAPTA